MPDDAAFARRHVTFAWDDAWVLASFAMLGRHPEGHGIRAIISAADYINHAIIKYEELNNGLARLVSAGYVLSESSRFRLAPVVEELLLSLGSQPRMNDVWGRFEQLLGVKRGQSPESQATIHETATISREEYQAALDDYLRSFL